MRDALDKLAELLEVKVTEPTIIERKPLYAKRSHEWIRTIRGIKGFIWFYTDYITNTSMLAYRAYGFTEPIPFTYQNIDTLFDILDYIGLHISAHTKIELIRSENARLGQ